MKSTRATTIYFVRHSQTPCVRVNRFCGDHEASLTPEGMEMNCLVREREFPGAELVLTSPRGRACATAQTIAESKDLPVVVDEGVRETSFGGWENLLPSELGEPERLQHQRWEANPALHAPSGGETGLAVMARAVEAVRRAAEGVQGMIVVSHKAPIRLVLSFFLDLPPARYRDLSGLKVSSVTELSVSSTTARLRSLGDVSHLHAAWQGDPDTADFSMVRDLREG